MTEVKMYLHETYQDDELEEVYVEPWEQEKGVPQDDSRAFLEMGPLYEVAFVFDHDLNTGDFTLVRVEGVGGRDYVVER